MSYELNPNRTRAFVIDHDDDGFDPCEIFKIKLMIELYLSYAIYPLLVANMKHRYMAMCRIN